MSDLKEKFSVQGFYGSKNKRKWIGIERSVDEIVKKHKQERIPAPFPSRIIGPSTSWKTFFRQKDAFDYSRSKAKDLHVFAFESSSYDGNSGQRLYLVTSYPVFWHYYSQMLEERRHHYEVIPEGAACKLYFDLEFNTSLNPNSNGNRMVDLLIEFVCLALDVEFGVKCSRKDVLDLEASTKEKFSRHLIFQLKRAVFKDNIHAGRFVSYMMSQLTKYRQTRTADVASINTSDNSEAIVNHDCSTKAGNNQTSSTSEASQTNSIGSDIKRSHILQTKVCGKSNIIPVKTTETKKCDEDFLCSDSKEGTENKVDSLHCETKENQVSISKFDDRYIDVLGRFTLEDIHTFFINTKNEDEGLFCDLGVYTKNRNFRLYLSSKLNKRNPLVLSTENQCQISDKPEDIFLVSLISNTKFSTSTKILTFEKESEIVGFPRMKSERADGKDSIEGYNMSPYPEVDEYITMMITEAGNRGVIRHWTYFHQGELLVYEISRYRFCHNIGRQHRSNNIMFIVDLHKGVFYQKCHDPDCYSQNYKSPEWELPKNVLPESYFTDIDDEFDLEMDDQELLDSTLELEQQVKNKSTETDELDDGEDEDLINAAEIMETSVNVTPT